jgi:hypothetical protein
MNVAKGFFSMGLECQIGWPSKERRVSFRGHDIVLRPETDELAPSAVIRVDKALTQGEARRLLQEFLSGLAWAERGRITETFSVLSTGGPIAIGKGNARVISDAPIEYIPDPSDAEAKLALALYREAISVNMVAYRFLGFFKIINILRKSGSDQKRWINQTLPTIGDRDAKQRLVQLRDSHSDIGDYLYVSGRCAIAHAFNTPLVNPDNPEDLQRLRADLPLMKALAEYGIEHELGVKSRETTDKEHLYELEGFRDLFGPEYVRKLKAGEVVDPEELHVPSKLSLRLRQKERIRAFEAMDAWVAAVKDGTVSLRMQTSDERLGAIVLLCFKDERLVFDAMHDLVVQDDGSVIAAQHRIDALRFFKGWIGNGVNEVWDPSTERRLGRSQPVMPVNMRPNFEAIDGEIRELQARIGHPAE